MLRFSTLAPLVLFVTLCNPALRDGVPESGLAATTPSPDASEATARYADAASTAATATTKRLTAAKVFPPHSGEAAVPVVREILARMDEPPGAPGRHLTLVRYTIAPGARLAPHTHPGVQVGSIVSGTLSYQVVAGAAIIQRNVGADGTATSTEELVGPRKTKLAPGDVVIEQVGMIHFGSNETDQPVVIIAALITEGQELAAPVPAPSEPPIRTYGQ